MFSYIKGKYVNSFNGCIILENSGIGYKIFMSNNSIGKIGRIGDEVCIYTYMRVLEDDISLFGFNTIEELNLFEVIISVSGIGAKTALAMLATYSPSELALAVVNEDFNKITKVPGIGPKSAKRIVLELKDKVNKNIALEDNKEEIIVNTDNLELEEAISALQVLGYAKKDIVNVFNKVDINGKNIQELIKLGLKYLS